MDALQVKLEICKAAASLTAAVVPVGSDNFQRMMNGKFEPEEKLANLEAWETFKVFCAGIANSIKPENASTLGFEGLDALLSGGQTAPPPMPEDIPNPGE